MIAINHTYTMWDCGPHTHCADRTPHSKLKKVHTCTVNHTVLLTSNYNKKSCNKNFFLNSFLQNLVFGEVDTVAAVQV